MRKTILYFIANCEFVLDFAKLAADERIKLIAVALNKEAEEIAWRTLALARTAEKQEEKGKKK